MKKMKKILALALAGAMTLAMGIAVSAHVVTINNEATGYSYKAYQIFTGDLDDGTLSNIEWGDGVTNAAKSALYSRYSLTGTDQTARKVAEAMAAVGDTEAEKKAEADAVATLIAKTTTNGLGTANALTYDAEKKEYASGDLASGYYLVVNDGVPAGVDKTAYSDYIVEVVKNVTVTPKSDVPTSVKKVQDINDSDATPTLSELMDSADYDIQDTIPYTLTATLPSDYANYEAYYLQFQDDMSEGLTLDASSVKIFYGSSDTTGTAITFTEDTSATSNYTNGKVYTYTIADLKTGTDAQRALKAGDVITITYNVTLNDKAVIGETGNPNRYRIVYSNNPNNAGEGKPTGTTPWDMNLVLTYKAIFDKYTTEDDVKKHLGGAGFTLYKVKASITDEQVKAFDATKDASKALLVQTYNAEVSAADKYESETAEVAGSRFTFNGIDDGTYVLVETTTPQGYNTVDPIKFVVNADHSIDSATPVLEKLTGNKTTGVVEVGAEKKTDGNNILTSEIENNKGATLPSTGGMGTTIFYVIGAILVLGAGVLLVSRKRMSTK